MNSEDTSRLEVGDELAFTNGYGRECVYVLMKIERITPTRRFICGHYTLDSDLSVRGDYGRGWNSVQARLPTKEIIEGIKRRELINEITNAKLQELRTSSLHEIAKIISEETE